MSPASVQLRLDLDSVAHDVARFGSGARAHRLAVLDVTAADQSLASADDAEQEELLAGRAQFLNAQLTPFQVLVRAEPVDLGGHLERVRRQALGPRRSSSWARTTWLSCARWPTSGRCSSAAAT